MIDTAFVEQRMRDVNPVPGVDHIDTAELSRAIAVAQIESAIVMQAPSQQQRVSTFPPQQRRAWVFAAAFVLVIATIGIVALFVGGDATPVADMSAAPTIAVEELPGSISVDPLTWTRISLGTEGPGVFTYMTGFHTPTTSIAEGGPGLVIIGVHPEPDPNDLADAGGGPGWVQGYLDVPTVWISPDGYEWFRVTSGDDTIGVLDSGDGVAGIAGRDDLLVVVAETNAWTSPDGLTWSQVPDGTFRENVDRVHGVIEGGPGFVAFGEDEVAGRSAIWTSPDGYTWTRVPDDPAVFSADIHAMTAGGPGLVAVGSSHGRCAPVVWISPDGYSWTRLPHDPAVFGDDPSCGLGGPGEMRIRDVSTARLGLVAVGSYDEQAAVWTSPDGITWTRIPENPSVLGPPPDMADPEYSEMIGIAATGDVLVAIGRRGGAPTVWSSYNGFTWVDITDDLDPPGGAVMIDVIGGGPGIVIVGENLVWIASPSEPTE